MALACGVLVLGDADGPRAVPAMHVTNLDTPSDGIVPREVALDRARWNAIVIPSRPFIIKAMQDPALQKRLIDRWARAGAEALKVK